MSIKNQIPNEKHIDLRKVFKSLYSNWYWFAGSVIFCLILAVGAYKLLRPQYQVYSSVYIKEDMGLTGEKAMEFMQSFSLFDRKMNYQNEMLFLKSSPLLRQTISKLELETAYFLKENFIYNEIYKASPFFVSIDSLHPQIIDTYFDISFNEDGTFQVRADKNKYHTINYTTRNRKKHKNKLDFEGVFFQSDVVESDGFKFKVFLNEDVNLSDIIGKQYRFKFYDKEDLVMKYQEQLKVVPVNPDVSVVEISIKTPTPEKDVDFIYTLTNLYLQRNLDRKNHLARNTISYINTQLEEIGDSLNFAENTLQNFRSSNQVISINTKSTRVLEQLKQLELGRETTQRTFNYYENLEEYFTTGSDYSNVVVPSSMGVQNLTLSELIKDLLILSKKRDDLIANKQEKSPFLRNLEIQITNLSKSIEENIRFSLSSLQKELDDYQEKIAELEKQVENLPKTERKLLGMERKFQISDAIYTFLLQKRAEAQISKASNLPEHEIVEPARILDKVFPKLSINLIFAVFLGLIIPGSVMAFYEIVDDRIKNEDMLTEKYVNTSFLGTIIKKPLDKNNLVVHQVPSSSIAETFRTIRTNLFYFMQGEEHKNILISSSVAGEGKSFVSFNLATSLANLGKKTIVIGFDLRKKGQFVDFEHNNAIGLSSYYIKEKELNEVICQSHIENLDFIAPGIIPPNPLELIGSEMTKQLFEELNSLYDYIVIDTPPLGVLSDAFMLMKYSDVNLFVVRERFTHQDILDSVLAEIRSKGFTNIGLILNGSNMDGKKYKYNYNNNYSISHEV
jgi:capsular exopolysaccharide synthesis family protein